MTRKKSLRQVSLGIIFLMVITVGVSIIYSHKNEPSNTPTTTESSLTKPTKKKEPQQKYGYPVRLQIPSINIDAPVQYVGLTDSGDMASPSNITDAGWYKLGTRPGNPGSAVLGGHFNGPQGQPGVFSRINELKPGDIITATDNMGSRVAFKVTQLRTYTSNEQPAEVFKSDDDVAHLNLITCSGAWNAQQSSYTERTVVFTNLVNL